MSPSSAPEHVQSRTDPDGQSFLAVEGPTRPRYTLADLLEPRAKLAKLLDLKPERPVLARRAVKSPG